MEIEIVAQLILTEEEKNLEKWSDFDNEALAKLARFSMLQMKNNDEQLERLHMVSAAYLLVFAASRVNATKLTQTLDEVTLEGKSIGDWKITVEKIEK